MKQADEAQKIRTQNEIKEQLTADTTCYARNMQNVKFDGHLYVVYLGKFGVGMVHSPNCECSK